MGTALQNNDILACRVWATLDGQAAVNTYAFQVFAVTGGTVDDQQLSDGVDLIVAAAYKSLMAITARYNGVQTYFLLRSGALPAPVKSVGSAGAGTSPDPTVPLNAAAIFKYATFNRGPSGRGRVFLPFLSSLNVDTDGHTTSSCDVTINSMASLLLTPLVLTSGGSSATAVWSLIHRHPKPSPPTATQIISAESSGKFGQQHKRGLYGRPNVSPI